MPKDTFGRADCLTLHFNYHFIGHLFLMIESLSFKLLMNGSCRYHESGEGSTLNVDVIRCARRKFFKKKYPNCNFEGCFGKNGFHFPKIFQKTLKIPKSEFYTLKIRRA